ncbi:MAG: NfeD family protein [Dehalococcoidales bacterium]|jgi:membrane-bound ClpP family serine protease
MNKKGELSALKAWLLVLASLIDDALVLALVFLALWYFHVKITWPLILIIAVIMVAFVYIMHKAVIPSIRRKKVTGAEGMLGATGTVTEPLKPAGTVKIKGEYWEAKSINGDLEIGAMVEVVKIDGLHLEVRKKP